MLELVTQEMSSYVSDSIRDGRLNDQGAALVRLFKGIAQNRIVTLAFEVAGAEGAAWTEDRRRPNRHELPDAPGRAPSAVGRPRWPAT